MALVRSKVDAHVAQRVTGHVDEARFRRLGSSDYGERQVFATRSVWSPRDWRPIQSATGPCVRANDCHEESKTLMRATTR